VTNVLFVCVANSGRSVMAERIFRQLAGDRHQARSAGSDPGTAPHSQVVEALREVGIDASDHVPRKLDADALAWADVAVSTCSEDVCPVTPGMCRISWELPDPKSLPLDQVRPIRDEIKRRVEQLVHDLDQTASAAKEATRHALRLVCLHAQRRPLADGAGLLRALRT
jgi:arsenate reductase